MTARAALRSRLFGADEDSPGAEGRAAHRADHGNRDVETRTSGSSRGTEQATREEFGGADPSVAKARTDLVAEKS